MALKRSAPDWLGWLLAAGLLCVFLGERVLGGPAGAARYALSGLGGVAVLVATLWRVLSWRAAPSDSRRVEGILALCYAGCVLALALHFATTDPALRALGMDLTDEHTRRIRGPLLVAWTLVLALSFIPALAAQLALGRRRPEGGAAQVEEIRVLEAGGSGLVVALAAASLLALGYVVEVRDKTLDLSYFKTATPGTATEAVVAAAPEPVRTILFFPQVSPVKDEVLGYFRKLADATGRLAVEEHDRLSDPKLAEQYQVTQDGTVLFVRGDRTERLEFGNEMATARTTLRALDKNVQSTLGRMLKGRRIVYLTIGHGELGDSLAYGRIAAREPGATQALRELLNYVGYDATDLGIVGGLGADVPADASAVMVLGPRLPFSTEEMASLERYLDRGGSLLLALDPEGTFTMGPLEKKLGVRYVAEPLADEEQHVRQRGDDSDRRLIITNRFSSHAAVTTLARAGMSAGILMIGPGRLERVDSVPVTPNFAVRSLESTFVDKNGDYTFDAKTETKGPFNLMAAIDPKLSGDPEAPDTMSSKPGAPKPFRAIVFASSSGFTEPVLVGIAPNAALVADAVRWLGHDETLAGTTTSEEDQPVVHTRGQDIALFYAAILGVPALVLAGGLAGVVRRRRGRGGAA